MTPPDIAALVARLRRLESEAGEAPWAVDGDGSKLGEIGGAFAECEIVCEHADDAQRVEQNAALIVEMRNGLIPILDENTGVWQLIEMVTVERDQARAERDSLRAQLEEWKSRCTMYADRFETSGREHAALIAERARLAALVARDAAAKIPAEVILDRESRALYVLKGPAPESPAKSNREIAEEVVAVSSGWTVEQFRERCRTYHGRYDAVRVDEYESILDAVDAKRSR